MSDAPIDRSRIVCGLVLVFFAGLTFLCRQHVFFWDTVQFAGKHGLWFYEQNFASWLLPPEIDSGHPPVFGWYLAALWKLFGKSLAVSHWAMFPFLAGIVWQLHLLGRRLLKNIAAFWLIVIPLADPVFLGQSILVSPDIVLCFFFLLAVRAGWNQNFLWMTVTYLGMSMISMRGMMLVAAFALIAIWNWFRNNENERNSQHRWWWFAFLPAGLFSLIFLFIHYRAFGWIGYHTNSPWALSFAHVGAKGFFKNLIIFIWRWLDVGRIFIWSALLFLLLFDRVKTGRTIRSYYLRLRTSSLVSLFGLLFCATVLLSYSFLTYTGLQAHRYLLPCFLLFSIITVLGIDRFPNARLQKFLLPFLFLGLLSGNLWKYPDDMAQGWDGTLAHWPYYQLRDELLLYLDAEGISPDEVGTAFPEIGPLKQHDLSGRASGFKEKELNQDRWIFYSNVMNDFSDEEVVELRNNWLVSKKFAAWPVQVVLYERR